MKVVSAYLLAVLGGNTNPSTDNIKSILCSVGAEVDDAMIGLFLAEMSGKDLADVIACGREKLASVRSAGVASASSVAGAAGAAGAPAVAAAAAEETKEEKAVEEEEDDFMCSLFD